jgi:hypothetical protein
LLKKSILRQLWDPTDKFYKVITYVTPVQVAKGIVSKFVSVRELHGYTPWYVRCITCCTCCAVHLCAVCRIVLVFFTPYVFFIFHSLPHIFLGFFLCHYPTPIPSLFSYHVPPISFLFPSFILVPPIPYPSPPSSPLRSPAL